MYIILPPPLNPVLNVDDMDHIYYGDAHIMEGAVTDPQTHPHTTLYSGRPLNLYKGH